VIVRSHPPNQCLCGIVAGVFWLRRGRIRAPIQNGLQLLRFAPCRFIENKVVCRVAWTTKRSASRALERAGVEENTGFARRKSLFCLFSPRWLDDFIGAGLWFPLAQRE